MIRDSFIRLFTIVMSILAAITAMSQDFNGTWRGNMIAGPQSIPLVIHVQQNGEDITVTMDSPMQDLYDVPT